MSRFEASGAASVIICVRGEGEHALQSPLVVVLIGDDQ